MLKTLRAHTKWIMIIVAVCFVGMIIFAWGMDIGDRRTGVAAGIVGKINGEKITFNYYDNYVKSQRQMYGGNTRMTSDQERRIHEESWDAIVKQKVIEQDIKKRKITFTDRELVNFMRNNPPQFAYQPSLAPLFHENNQFSLSKYQAFLNPDNLNNPQTAQILRYIEVEASTRLPMMKFQQSLTDAVVITETQVKERWLRDNEKRKADWVFLNTGSIIDVGETVEPGEARAYYERHKEDFRREERRVLSAVFFSLAPTAKDSTDIIDHAKLLVEKARMGEDFSGLANEYSDDPGNTGRDGNRRGGELGFFGRGMMVKQFEDAAFSLKPGEVSEPVISQFGCHVIKVDSLKYKEDDPKEIDQVKARHILLNIEPSGDTRDKVESAVTSFRDAVADDMDFMIQAQLDSLQVIRTRPFEEDALTVQGITGSSALLVHRAFKAKEGDLLSIFVNESGYFVMRLENVFKAGIPALGEVSNEVVNAAGNEIRARYAEDVINRIYSGMQEGQSLKDVVEADSVKVASVNSSEVHRNFFIPGLGPMNTFVAKIFTLENPGDITGPVITESGSGIAVLTEILPVDEDQYEKDRDQTKTRLDTELKNEVITEYLNSLIESADIVDNRDMYVGW